jgi:hypothetical protein
MRSVHRGANFPFSAGGFAAVHVGDVAGGEQRLVRRENTMAAAISSIVPARCSLLAA